MLMSLLPLSLQFCFELCVRLHQISLHFEMRHLQLLRNFLRGEAIPFSEEKHRPVGRAQLGKQPFELAFGVLLFGELVLKSRVILFRCPIQQIRVIDQGPFGSPQPLLADDL
jgi:hypothetical protein